MAVLIPMGSQQILPSATVTRIGDAGNGKGDKITLVVKDNSKSFALELNKVKAKIEAMEKKAPAAGNGLDSATVFETVYAAFSRWNMDSLLVIRCGFKQDEALHWNSKMIADECAMAIVNFYDAPYDILDTASLKLKNSQDSASYFKMELRKAILLQLALSIYVKKGGNFDALMGNLRAQETGKELKDMDTFWGEFMAVVGPDAKLFVIIRATLLKDSFFDTYGFGKQE